MNEITAQNTQAITFEISGDSDDSVPLSDSFHFENREGIWKR